MSKYVKIPWGAWYQEQEDQILEFPDNWEIAVLDMAGSTSIGRFEEITNAIENPIGVAPLQEIAQGNKTAVIVFEDISRPTKCEPICEVLIKELNKAGIKDENITFIAAVGSHRPMNRNDFIKKLGRFTVHRFNIENHHPYENLIELGESYRGTPIFINKTYIQADIKIAISTVVPHPLAGYGGGAKIILPGISGIKTLEANHEAALEGQGVGLGFITELRKDIEEICQTVGLDFSVNIISTKNREIAGIFAGDYVKAHRKAIELAKVVYNTELPQIKSETEKFDIGFFNLFPEDTELSQSSKGTNLFMQASDILKENAVVVFMTASSEGRGYHSLLGETGGRLYESWKAAVEILLEFCEEKTFAVYSPNLNRADIDHYWSDKMLFSRTFPELLNIINDKVGKSPKAVVFPTSIQLLS